MKKNLFLILMTSLMAINSHAQNKAINVIVIGAHPDDCDFRAGGTAIKFAQMGHNVMFVSLCNGDAGHYKYGRKKLAGIRKAEAQEAGRRFGVKYVVLDHHDCELLPDLKVRQEIIKLIREWKADIVIGPRPYDYHADHRSTATAIQDAAYLVIVPHTVPGTPALQSNPLFLYHEDSFEKPLRFTPDIVVDISDVFEKKIYALSAHESQFFDWLPWTNWQPLKDGEVVMMPKDEKERDAWFQRKMAAWLGKSGKFYEYFEICEYGMQPSEDEIKNLFPILGKP
jgi:LmbE family N-acetylglucosaminyl deacetylase